MSKVFADEYTRVLQECIREIETDPAEYLGSKYMPSVDMPTSQIFVDVLQARGGLAQESAYNADPKAVPRRQFRTQQFSPGCYKEFIRFNEQDILLLRELGKNDQSGRGIRQHLNENAIVLNNRLEARAELLRWQALLNGTFTYDGKVVDFGKPGNHDVAPVAAWGTSSGGAFTAANNSATPIQDLRFWLLGGYAPFRKYKITKMVMNPNTARMILDNTGVQSLIQMRFASDSYGKQHDIKQVLSFLIPGCPEIEIYEGWYQPETVDNTTGAITVGDAVYFIPDGRIFFEAKLPGGDKLGDVAMTLNLSNGSIDNPAAGKFLLVDEHIKDKPGNPYVDVLGGFFGGPRLKRGFDCLTATVI